MLQNESTIFLVALKMICLTIRSVKILDLPQTTTFSEWELGDKLYKNVDYVITPVNLILQIV